MLKKPGARMTPMFADSEDRLHQERASMAAAMPSADAQMFGEVPDLSLYYRVDAADDSLDELAAQLVKCTAVNAAYVKPPAYPSQQHAITAAAATGPSGQRSEEHRVGKYRVRTCRSRCRQNHYTKTKTHNSH